MNTQGGAIEAEFERLLIGNSRAMREVRRLADLAAPTAGTVLIVGETGTGKELVARRIHARSPRKDGSFVAVNMSAFQSALVEAELFGHARGAFTGAHLERAGLFERAHGGSLFLDEVGDTPLELQKKLLRVLQEKTVCRLMDSRVRPIDVRIIAATNRCVESMVARGEMREDFFYRINVTRIQLPPLRERLEDLPLLVEHLVRIVSARLFPQNPPAPLVEPGVLDLLARHRWPGNVRELENALERAVSLEPGLISCATMSQILFGASAGPAGSAAPNSLACRLDEFTRDILETEISAAHGCKRKVAKALGISESKLFRLCRRHCPERNRTSQSRSRVTGARSEARDAVALPELAGLGSLAPE